MTTPAQRQAAAKVLRELAADCRYYIGCLDQDDPKTPERRSYAETDASAYETVAAELEAG